jgi:hypothetical protein
MKTAETSMLMNGPKGLINVKIIHVFQLLSVLLVYMIDSIDTKYKFTDYYMKQ